jgi:DNA-binding NtrC family response regulator
MPNMVEFIGVSSAAARVRQDIECAARTDAKVLITGESGVGKEVVAQLIHQRSGRRHAPLLTINCAGIPDTLLASELFGHTRGSFTDAYRDKQGWLEEAHHGTIFMDEIGEMSLQMQSMLLRFLENGEIQRVGSDRRVATVNVRIITATNRRLSERVAANEFREDLFYRVSVIHIEIPPLRERPEDVPALIDYFLQHFSVMHHIDRPLLSAEAMAQLVAAPWPGNVRQLRNVTERLVVGARQRVITAGDLPRDVLSMGLQPGSPSVAKTRPRTEILFERMMKNGETFWRVVYEPFMARDLTREDLRMVVQQGLALSGGNYRKVSRLFNVPGEHRRLKNFLRRYQCHFPLQDLPMIAVERPEMAGPLRRAVGE